MVAPRIWPSHKTFDCVMSCDGKRNTPSLLVRARERRQVGDSHLEDSGEVAARLLCVSHIFAGAAERPCLLQARPEVREIVTDREEGGGRSERVNNKDEDSDALCGT